MKLVVGLGNPGRQYQRTPHNVGFEIVEKFAGRNDGIWHYQRRYEAETCELMFNTGILTLMRPMTYMNLSGQSVAAWCQKNGVEPGDVLAISDDINLPLGRLRIRPGGSHGGHKGLLSIINSLGSLDFPRLRIGVKPAEVELDDWIDFVLRPLRPEHRDTLLSTEDRAVDAVEAIRTEGLAPAMNRFNRAPDDVQGET